MSEPLSEYMHFIFLFGLSAFIIVWIAYTKNFFSLPVVPPAALPSISFTAVLIPFSIYLCVSLLLIPFLYYIIHSLHAKWHPGTVMPLSVMHSVQLFSVLFILALFSLFAFYRKKVFKRIVKNWNISNAHSISVDFAMGLLTWFIAFPCVAVVGEVMDMLSYLFFGLRNYEQVAVRYLKMSLSSVETLIIPLFIILIAAPAIEEFLFRGCLQTYFKTYMGRKKAIALSSLCFAFFHFSMSQGLGNISLLVSLFTFSLFLGFIYERQASLFSSIALHMSFNLFSTIRILFFSQ